LPTSETARGFHVYFRTNALAGRTAKMLGEGRGTARHNDGELLGNSYAILPPSRHPSGIVYRWHNEPRDSIPFVADPVAAGLAFSASKNGGVIQESSSLVFPMRTCGPAEREAAVREAIAATIPVGTGQRNACLGELSRRLAAIPDLTQQDIRAAVEE